MTDVDSPSSTAEQPLPDLATRIGAALASDWQQPPIGQPALRQLNRDEKQFRVGVTWPSGAATTLPEYRGLAAHAALARDLEDAGADYILISDGWTNPANGASDAGLRSPLWAVPVILGTDRIGVITTMRTTFMAPMHVARFGSHLDWLSQGRWGWCVVTGGSREIARLYGLDDMPPARDRYARAAEVVAVVKSIWSSAQRGVDFGGKYVQVSGRSKRPFPTQSPRPPMVGVGTSKAALELAASQLDIWIAEDGSPEVLATARRSLAEQAEAAARPSPRIHLKALLDAAGINVKSSTAVALLGPTIAHAVRKIQYLFEQRLIDGILLDLPNRDTRQIHYLREFISALEDLGVLEGNSASRAAHW